MKRIEARDDGLVLELTRQEKDLLQQLLSLYPLVPASHHPVTKGPRSPRLDGSQKLLDEALAERRLAHQEAIRKEWFSPDRFAPHKAAFRVHVARTQIEDLLEILNDVRVGSWLRLGSPDNAVLATIKLTDDTAPCLWAMEACGYFQVSLLDVIQG